MDLDEIIANDDETIPIISSNIDAAPGIHSAPSDSAVDDASGE